MRVKGGAVTQRRHKKILKMVKGQWGTRSKLFRRANEAMMKSYWYAYRDRRVRRREFRKLWITRINAASRQNGLSYSRLMHGLKMANVGIDRKALADIAVRDAAAFTALTAMAKDALENGGPSRQVVEMTITRPGAVGHSDAVAQPKPKAEKAPEPVVEPETPVEVEAAEEMRAAADTATVESAEVAPEAVVEPITPIEVEAAEEMQAEAKEATIEPVEAKKEAPSPKKAKKAKKDDLKKIEGIGPKIASVLKDAGIETFAQLADTSVEELDKIVRQDAGVTIAKPDTWPEQAALAAEGRMEDLEALQDTLKGGVRQ